jgi:hypothetical protein
MIDSRIPGTGPERGCESGSWTLFQGGRDPADTPASKVVNVPMGQIPQKTGPPAGLPTRGPPHTTPPHTHMRA